MNKSEVSPGFEKFLKNLTSTSIGSLNSIELAQNLSRMLKEHIDKQIPDISKAYNTIINPAKDPGIAQIVLIKIFDHIKINEDVLKKDLSLVNKNNPDIIFGDYKWPIMYDNGKICIDFRHFTKPISIWSIAFMLGHELFHHYLWHNDEELDADKLLAINNYKKILYILQFTKVRTRELVTDSHASSLCHNKWVPLNLMQESFTYFGTDVAKNNWLSTHPTTQQRVDNLFKTIQINDDRKSIK